MIKREHGAFIHARYSTDNQNPDSIDVQVSKCREWCREHALPVLGVFSDEAVSGMKDTRPQYAEMMRQLRLGYADTVVIYDQSRMFRKMTAWFSFRDALSEIGVQVVCVTQPMIGKDLRDPTNFLTEGSMALFNQIWALQTRQKVMEKMRYMARSGLHTGGMPPLGYIVENGRFVICEEEAAVVRRIFTEYASGKSYREIISGLNADALTTKKGNPFGSNSLHDLLHNEKYIGTLVYGQSPLREDGTRNRHAKNVPDVIRIEDALPAIIDKELFEKVQQRMARNKHKQGGRPATVREYPLRGRVFCADCKMAMTITTSQERYHYYRCTGKKRLHNCDAAPIGAEYLEDIVVQAIRETLGSPTNVGYLIRILREQAEQIQSGAVSKLRFLLDKEKEVDKKLSNAMDAILDGLASPALKARVTELEGEKASISRELRTLRASVDASAIPEKRLEEILSMVVNSADGDPSVLLSIVSRVEVGKEFITIWTLLDVDPDGHIDYEQNGVTITPGHPSGVPKNQAPIRVPDFFCQKGLERSNPTRRWRVGRAGLTARNNYFRESENVNESLPVGCYFRESENASESLPVCCYFRESENANESLPERRSKLCIACSDL